MQGGYSAHLLNRQPGQPFTISFNKCVLFSGNDIIEFEASQMEQFHNECSSSCETLSKTINKNVLVNGMITMSVVEMDLIYQGLRVILTSPNTALNMKKSAAIGKLVESYLEKEGVLGGA